MLLLAAVVWPVGLVALVRLCTSAGPVGWMAAGALAGVTGAFPLTLMSWGLVLPYFLCLTMMPMAVIVIAHLAGVVPPSPRRLRPVQLAVLLPVVLLAVVLAHPQGLFVGIVLGVPILVWATAARARELFAQRPVRGRSLRFLLPVTVGAAVLSAVAWQRFRPSPESAFWTPTASAKEAVGQALSLAPNGAPTWIPMGLVVMGCATATLLGSRSRWLVAPWAAAVAMSVVTRSVPEGPLRYLLTGNWYSDNHRIAAIIAVSTVPVLAVGLDVLVRRAAQALPALRGHARPVLALAMALGVLTLGVAAPGTRSHAELMAADWRPGRLLTEDEREVLERLPEVVPEDAVIATNALNGSALAYAISDRQVLNTYMAFRAVPEVHLLNAKLDDAQEDPAVCDAVHELGVEYALDFGPREIGGGHATYTGLNEISETGAAEVVLQVGDAKLLRMLPCTGTGGRELP